jgi:hypothetical protein
VKVTFDTAREAKQYLAGRIAAQAERENIVLPEPERKMLYYSETAWTLPDMRAAAGEFDRQFDQAEYERKIVGLVQRAYRRDVKESPEDYDKWWAAMRALSHEDHYVLVMLRQAHLRPKHDLLKLWGAGCLTTVGLLGFVVLVAALPEKTKAMFTDYLPAGKKVSYVLWVASVLLYLGMQILRWRDASKRR